MKIIGSLDTPEKVKLAEEKIQREIIFNKYTGPDLFKSTRDLIMTRTQIFEKFLKARAIFEKNPDQRSALFAMNLHRKYLATFE